MDTPVGAYERYLPWRRTVEIGFWLGFIVLNTLISVIVAQTDVARAGLDIAPWEPAAWEISSSVLWLVLVPAIAAFSRRFPLYWETWRGNLPLHLLATVVVSLVHVGGMVTLRKLFYASRGEVYDFGSWPHELTYEYLKDLRSYASILLTIEAYRLFLRRLQGEVSLLASPDEGLPVEPIDRPERFLVRKLGREFLVQATDIDWLQASGNYVNLHVKGRAYPLRSTIAGIEARVDPRRFARVHRSYIVNLDRLASIEPLETGDARLHLTDGNVLPCSRRYRAALRGRAGVPDGRDAA
ncbi:MAG: LytTR family transcriptional regulator [Xanthomonadales bacterium]|nr:LytTR family transcriptional regulator [Xanthomonadales bacterium]